MIPALLLYSHHRGHHVVAAELIVIAWVRNRYMESSFFASVIQVVVGGVLVFLAGILIGIS